MRLLSLLCFLAAPFARAGSGSSHSRRPHCRRHGQPFVPWRCRDPRQPDRRYGPSGIHRRQARPRGQGSHRHSRLHRHAQPLRLHLDRRRQCAEHDPPRRHLDDPGRRRIGRTHRREADSFVPARPPRRRRSRLERFHRLLCASASPGNLHQRRKLRRIEPDLDLCAWRTCRTAHLRRAGSRCARSCERRWNRERSA